MGLDGGRVVARRINLRADHPTLIDAVLPHEVAHVYFADLFPTRQIPRWADEGMAVLAEPESARADRLADLDEPLRTGRLFRIETLMTAAMPDGRYWDIFIAEGASVTSFLVGLDTPTRFVAFLREAERSGPEAALERVYGMDDYAALERRWLDHARQKSEGATAALADRPAGSPRR